MSKPSEASYPGSDEATEGRRIGRFRVVRKIDSGGMGVVYEVADQQDDVRQYALKTLYPEALPDQRRRFRAEGEALTRLRHPHIASVLEVGVDQGRDYLVMTLVRGQHIDIWAETQPLPRHLLVLADIVDALATVHRAGKLHRDIKPGNVLVTDDHHGFLVDFGLVYETGAEGITLGDKVVGTPSYMAPEQIRTERRDLTAAVDIWGIGVLLYQLLTGRLPFDGDTPYEIFDHIIGLRPQPPSALAAGLPEDLNRVVGTCLAKDPARRYESAEALAADLRRVAAGEAIPRREIPTWSVPRWFSPVRRLPMVELGIGLGALVVIWAILHRYPLSAVLATAVVGVTGIARFWWRVAIEWEAEAQSARRQLAGAERQQVVEARRDWVPTLQAQFTQEKGQHLWDCARGMMSLSNGIMTFGRGTPSRGVARAPDCHRFPITISRIPDSTLQ